MSLGFGSPRYFFGFRAAMYVVRTAMMAMTIAISTAAVGQSMPLLRFVIGGAVYAACCRRYVREPELSRVVGPVRPCRSTLG